MVMKWLFGETCVRCDKQRTKREFEGLPTCEECELKLKATQEPKRRCPVDGGEMSKEIIHNLIIDRCPACAGVWLDSGELELVKKAIAAGAPDNFTPGFVLGMMVG
jgi:hypothetical protein